MCDYTGAYLFVSSSSNTCCTCIDFEILLCPSQVAFGINFDIEMVEAPDLKKIDEKPAVDVKPEEEEAPEAVEGVKFDILEEDDDFEEFKDDEWEDTELNVDEDVEWEDDWDDEEDDDDFAKRLRAEVAANKKKLSA